MTSWELIHWLYEPGALICGTTRENCYREWPMYLIKVQGLGTPREALEAGLVTGKWPARN